MARHYSCKIGTIPSLVIFWRRYKVEVGKILKVRDYHHGTKWFRVLVEAVNDDGYFFAARI